MRLAYALLDHPTRGPLARYPIAGAAVAVVYPGAPFVLTSLLRLPIEVVIPIAYVAAVCRHFTLQRHFVFRHVGSFALSTRAQIARYVAIGAIQYPTAAISTAVLPGVLGVPARVVYVCTVFTVSLMFFLALRTHVFHPAVQRTSELP